MVNASNSDRETSRSLFAFPWLWRALVAAIVIATLIRAVVVQIYYVPTASMVPTLQIGDRIVVDKFSGHWRAIQRGDVVVFDGADVWTTQPGERGIAANVARFLGITSPSATDTFVKRVIGIAGDHVVCCTPGGRITVNGHAITEPYAIGASDAFAATVPAGRLWVMGDDRANSTDSRAYLGMPGGGSIPEAAVIGRVMAVAWPPSSAGILGAPGPKDGND